MKKKSDLEESLLNSHEFSSKMSLKSNLPDSDKQQLSTEEQAHKPPLNPINFSSVVDALDVEDTEDDDSQDWVGGWKKSAPNVSNVILQTGALFQQAAAGMFE